MKSRHPLLALLFCVFFVGGVQAAGAPMNQDFSQLMALSRKAIDSGKAGNSEALVEDTVAAFSTAKEQNTTSNSPTMQRILRDLKTARNSAQDGKTAEAVAALEAAMAKMQEGPKAPKFGGGS